MSSSLVHIGRSNDNDPNYRYKMPQLEIKFEGGGNGKRTSITNLIEVAQALHIHPAYVIRYFAIELSVSNQFDLEKKYSSLKGHHELSQLMNILNRFISLVILCPSCQKPELKHDFGSKSISIVCDACPHTSVMRESDHRIITYMMKHPPKLLQQKKVRKCENSSSSSSSTASTRFESNITMFNSLSTLNFLTSNMDQLNRLKDQEEAEEALKKEKKRLHKLKKEGKLKEKEERKKKKTKESKKKKVKKAKEQISSESGESDTEVPIKSVNILELSQSITNEPIESPVTTLEQFILNSSTSSTKLTSREILNELHRIGISRNLNERQKLMVLLETTMPLKAIPKETIQQLRSNVELLRDYIRYSSSNGESDSSTSLSSMMILLKCIEEWCGSINRQLLPVTSSILKLLYDEEILNEEVILAWYKQQDYQESQTLSSSMIDYSPEVKSHVSTFIQWLMTAEEESDNEQDESKGV